MRPVGVRRARRARGHDRPVDRVEAGHVGDPGRHEAELHERAREERQRQQHERDRTDQRLALARDEREGVRERRERGAEHAGHDDAGSRCRRRRCRKCAPTSVGEADDDQRLDRDREHAVGHAPEVERAAPDRRDEEAVHDAALHVVDERHAVPAGRRDRRHDDDAGREVVDVAAALEARDVDDALEERAEEQQPDDRLDERDRNPGGLADEGAQVAQRDVPAVAERSHAAVSSRSARSRPRGRRGRPRAGRRRRATDARARAWRRAWPDSCSAAMQRRHRGRAVGRARAQLATVERRAR